MASWRKKLPRRHLDIRLAVTWGDRLNLVEAHGEGMRFPHSIMQAYLASRFMSIALQDRKFQQDAVTRLRSPGREFLIALVLYARSEDTDRKGQASSEPEAASAERPLVVAAEPRAAGTPGTSRNEPEVSESTAPGAGTATATSTPPGPAQDPADRQTPSAGLSTGPAQASSGPALCSDVRSIRDVLFFLPLGPGTTSRSSTCMLPRWKSTASSTSPGTRRSREVSQSAGTISAAETSGPSTRRNWGWSSASAMRCESSPTVPPAA